jgi:hypothetical protein
MFKLILLTLLTSHAFSCFSKVEINQKVEALARSFPIGGFGKFTIEAINPLWGKKNGPKDITYGFYGAQAEFRTSAVVNYISGKFFIYPVPILGLFVGKEAGVKEIKNIDTFDCSKSICQGKMKREFVGLRLALGFKDFFFMSENRWSNVEPDKASMKFVDEITTLLGSPGADQTWVSLNIMGLKLDENKKAGLIYLSNQMKKNKSNSKMLNVFYEHSWKKHSLISSAGVFKTREDQNVATLLFLYSWKTPSALRLF